MRGGRVLIVEDDDDPWELNAEYPFRGHSDCDQVSR
jgi:hypothetical protein